MTVSRPPVPAARWARTVGMIICVLGLSLTAVLAVLHESGCPEVVRSLCLEDDGYACREALCGAFGQAFGVPVAVLGAGWFALQASFLLFHRYSSFKGAFPLVFGSVSGIGVCSFLLGIEFFSIGHLCMLCLATKVLVCSVSACALFIWHRAGATRAAVMLAWVLPLLVGFGSGSLVQTPESRCIQEAKKALSTPEWRRGGGGSSVGQVKDRPIAILFYEDRCLFCCKFVIGDLAEPRVEASLARYDRTALRASEHPDLCHQFRVAGVPCLILLDTKGRTLRLYGGDLGSDRLADVLAKLE